MKIKEQIDKIWNFHKAHNDGKMLVSEFKKHTLNLLEQRNKEIFDELDKLWFAYGNSIELAINIKKLKLAKKFVDEFYVKYEEVKSKTLKE